jgi:hypothetical protein
VIFEEQVNTIGGGLVWLTVTLNEQLVTCPHELLAVQVTSVVPSPKQLPLGGLQNKLGGGLQPPLAVLV